MRLIHHLAELRPVLEAMGPCAFVPTMGNLHDGHLALVQQARQTGLPVVASVFVNPLQFAAGEDYGSYPRTLEADRALLQAAGTAVVFAPAAAEVYPEPQTFLVLPPLADELCGAHRPGHFQGVCTVVLKLFNMVRPAVAVFGKKDYQQLFLIKAMARQFNLPVAILAGETVRAPDGLALSSRNAYLNAAQRAAAPRLHRALRAACERLAAGETDLDAIASAARDSLLSHGWRVDYVAVRSQASLLPPTAEETRLVVLGAASLGTTRLIDNLEVDCVKL